MMHDVTAAAQQVATVQSRFGTSAVVRMWTEACGVRNAAAASRGGAVPLPHPAFATLDDDRSQEAAAALDPPGRHHDGGDEAIKEKDVAPSTRNTATATTTAAAVVVTPPVVAADADIVASASTLARQVLVAEKATRPLGFSYRPRRRPLPLTTPPGGDDPASSVEHQLRPPQPPPPPATDCSSAAPTSINVSVQCVEPTRRVQIHDDVNIHMTPRRAIIAATDDITTAENVRVRCLAAVVAHLRRFGTTAGLPTFCNPALMAISKRMQSLGYDDAFAADDARRIAPSAVLQTGTALLRAGIATLADLEATRAELRLICDAQLRAEETAAPIAFDAVVPPTATSINPAAATATAAGAPDDTSDEVLAFAVPFPPALLHLAILGDLPACTVVRNPCAPHRAGVGVDAPSASAFAAWVAAACEAMFPAWVAATQRNAAAATPIIKSAADAVAFLRGFVYPLLKSDGSSRDALVGREAEAEFVAAVATFHDHSEEQMMPFSLCAAAEGELDPSEPYETVWPLTAHLTALIDALLSVSKAFDRAYVLMGRHRAEHVLSSLLSGPRAQAMPRASWRSAAATALSCDATTSSRPPFLLTEGCGPLLTLPRRLAVLLDRIAAAANHELTRHLLTIMMRAQSRRLFGPTRNAPPLFAGAGPTVPPDSHPSYAFLRHALDVVSEVKQPMAAMIMSPPSGSLRFVSLQQLLTEFSP